MIYERQGLLLPEASTEAIDRGLYDSFKALHEGFKEVYKQLTLPDERKREVLAKWHSGEDADLFAKHVDEGDLLERIGKLQEWKRELISSPDIDPDIRAAYRWRINEDIANVHMLIASARGDRDRFRRYNDFIYGKPDEAIYRGALDWVAHDAEQLLGSNHPAPVKRAAEAVLGRLEDERGYRELLVPDEETFRQVREDHMRPGGYYALLLSGVEVPTAQKVTPVVGDPILKHVVGNNLQSDYTLANSANRTWGVAHSTGEVERPANYSLPWQRYLGLGLGHEVGSHLLERENGRRGPLALAEIGLDRLEKGNEGRATMREQVVYETFDEFGKLVRWRDILRRDIAIAYAYGVDEKGRRSSSDTYEFMNTIDTMYQAKLTPDDPVATLEKARSKTDALLLRVLKGGDVYLKDKVYLEGHVACWLTAASRPGAVSEGDLGKFDINNIRHIVLLQKLGLLPANT